jgi:fucose 4-O-acetylase-like acetyltransferase
MAATERAAGIDALVAATPASRERYVDFLRALSILAVILGHWIVSTIFWQDGRLYLGNAVGLAPGLWILTWVFQVMPIFFFVGGFSNYVAYEASERKGEPVARFIRRRVARLLWPALPFFAIWTLTQVTLHLANVGAGTGFTLWGHTKLLRGMDPPASTLPFGPMWFIVVYLVVVAIIPLTIRLHRRFRWAVPAAMIAGALACDVVGFGVDGMRWARYLNIVFVLLLPHQLGHFYGDGTLARLPRKAFWAMAIGGFGMLVVLTTPWLFQVIGNHARFDWFPGIGHYPKSLIGTGTESVSNAYPPTLCYLVQGIGSVGVAMLFRERASRWLQRPRPWKAVVVLNSVIMTLFLWFMTAYLIAILGLWPLGFGREHVIGPRWWLERPLWVIVPGVILVGLVALFGKWERRTHVRGRTAGETTVSTQQGAEVLVSR